MAKPNDKTKVVNISPEKLTEIKKIAEEFKKIAEEFGTFKNFYSRSLAMSHMYERRPNPEWELHSGCRPCAFVCDCCERMHHRCGSGENMWVYGKKSSCDFEKMLCDDCYYNKDKFRCSCKMVPGYAPIETDIKTGSRRVRNKCYEYAYPCKGCSLYITDEERDGDETMTYYEFLDRISRRKRKEYPSEYIDFLTQKRRRPIHESQ